MPYIAPEVITEAKRMDLLTYLKNYEPSNLVRFSSNTYCTKEHDSLKISNGKWMWWSRGIQDDVETELMKEQTFDVAKAYIRYRHEHELMRNGGVIDGKILTIVDDVNEEVIQENSNKNPTILSTQRDYIAGEVSRDISNRLLIPEDIRKAHEEGIIHFHDSDYFVQRMHNCCLVNLEDSLYGTPIESTTYKFAKALQKRFGVIEGITDKNYITNSYHVHVTEKINAFDKLRFEAEFQLLSPGGAISYIETANLNDNIGAVLAVIKYIYDHIMYAELNTKSDFCQVCGYDGEISIVENEDGKLIWECPNCGNRNKSKMNVARRTCGYIGTNDWNQGRTQEIKERYVHLGGE